MLFRIGIISAALLMVQQLLPAQPDRQTRSLHADAHTTHAGMPQPSLLPMPKELVWKNGVFQADARITILAAQEGLERETRVLKEWLYEKGYEAAIARSDSPGRSYLELRLDPAGAFENAEAYALEVTAKRILLTAPTSHGIFNGIQTLRQLWSSGNQVAQCVIKDAPAFLWRGYMIDVGRNYMPPELLKQQIDVMSRYKLNVFHFHATEDIAWRIAIDRYPQLTAPENMERDKGLYYSKKELLDLVAYCRERYITFVPEIDMPGHSAAFKRALKTDMQSDSGIVYVKQILSEFCDTYDVPYIHIGADEVKITNPSFIPEMTRYLQARGKKVIGWQPGGNFTDGTLLQLWKDDRRPERQPEQAGYIDSRHLYLNHMDPLEAVVSLFNRGIGAADAGAETFRGATLCVWHDRAVRAASDVLTMNPVYPGMLAFAERIWRGGGRPGWIANISDGDEAAFAEFEQRLLDHQQLYFSGMPFSYARQANLLWQLTGPYNNKGQLSASFVPEQETDHQPPPATTARGGTIVLRHWWYPLIKGAIAHPRDSTTWYARTRIWSPAEGKQAFWIGFNDLSRSMATDSPPEGAWDNRGNQLWVNNRIIPPPSWHRAGGKGDLEIPLTDEGYAYRPPVYIFLKKGWNDVLVKLPVGSFTARNWQNPVKWMFTFVPVN
ncbi:family 20 glycosylhydrolase [Niabella sp.]|uniref:family 20 glycosylhydrolase n=1 Tax=Niabella sp. TaxID=1962976 RepID=UPI002629AB80|nr:family 20 glycosylhydrolase [Niabella sp.]